MVVDLLKVVDRNGNEVQPVWKPESDIPQMMSQYSKSQRVASSQPIEIINSKRTKKFIYLMIQPFESVYLRFKIFSNVEKSKDANIQFKINTPGFNDIKINYGY